MARVCRKLAADLRAEAAAGWPDITLAAPTNQHVEVVITRAQAAASMDRQAARWEAEALTGVPNVVDRRKIGW